MKLHFQIQGEGQGQTVVVLHGLFGSLDNWRGIAKQLALNVKVVTVDLRNHGRSPHDPQLNYAAMAADIAELITDLKLGVIDIIGHSIGGKVAMELAHLYPQLIRKLMVIDMAPKPYPDRHSDIFNALLALDLSQYAKRSEVDAALALTISDKAIRQFLLMNLVTDETGLSWRINLAALSANYDQLLEAVCKNTVISTPTCFVRGGLSDYIDNDDIESIQQQFINSQVETIEGVGHWVHAESPQAFLTTAKLFFDYD